MRILDLGPAAPAAAATAMFLALLPGQAAAGLFDFFGSSSYQQQGVTPRQLVSFPPGYEPGSIVVQFSQRRRGSLSARAHRHPRCCDVVKAR